MAAMVAATLSLLHSSFLLTVVSNDKEKTSKKGMTPPPTPTLDFHSLALAPGPTLLLLLLRLLSCQKHPSICLFFFLEKEEQLLM